MQLAASRTPYKQKSRNSLLDSLDKMIKQIGKHEVYEKHEVLII